LRRCNPQRAAATRKRLGSLRDDPHEGLTGQSSCGRRQQGDRSS
jgi:hypothetical protein